jgi:putative hydrolase of the HAD superfamily
VPIRAVTLDAGGTLIAVAEPVGVTYARIAARHGIGTPPDVIERGFRRAFAGAPPLAFPGVAANALADHERRWWRAIVGEALGPGADPPAVDAAFVELFDHYGGAAAWLVFPDVPPALSALRARGIALAVVSNFDRRLPAVLDGLGLGPLLDAVVHSSGIGHAKPDPGIFEAALATLGVTPGEAMHVGDDSGADVGGAHRAGLRPVLIDRDGANPPLPPGVPRIATLAELPSLAVAHP